LTADLGEARIPERKIVSTTPDNNRGKFNKTEAETITPPRRSSNSFYWFNLSPTP